MSIIPPHDKDGVIVDMVQIDKQPIYIVTYDDKPYLRIGVKPQNILYWVSPLSYENWRQSQLREKILQENSSKVDGDEMGSMKDKMLAGQEAGNPSRERKRSPKRPTFSTTSKQHGYVLDSETEEEGDTLATDAALDRQLNGSLTNPSELNVKPSRSTSTSLPLSTGPARQTRTSSTSASAPITTGSEAKHQRTYGPGGPHKNLETASSTKLASHRNGSGVRTTSRPSPTRISPGARTKRLQMKRRCTPSTSSKQKQSATLPAPVDEEDDDSQYEVDEILADEFRNDENGKRYLYYLLKWKGGGDDSWEPAKNVGRGLIAEYKQKKLGKIQMDNLDKAASRGTNDGPMHIDINTYSGGKRTRDRLPNDESDEDSLFVGRGPSSRGDCIRDAKGKDVDLTLFRQVIDDDTDY
ncbi:hypothetical protein DL95DRAFT_503023 [Leptodontidium sp. 2 PMI_412]|nr:hypothetical protein DL95DRAFT_503023 [Leptodontidium sp. 2 PMI_412]